ncbi:maleylpyruvate isomerase family mycothiol-dependent enzyme [Pseudonocardia sp.]|uniref:maleylpyruvate isomerase family mycothiol-dependent enzyme n=1 Tax=Pseudonocardia sp. TaxID=60912 RepID=UPI0026316951|nr:maleylpyruvate isomerase family mycothiol-dependent enzyme [Pseudonocardia sp.]
MTTAPTERLLASIEADGHALGAAARSGRDATVRTCPDWTGADLLAHVSGFARYLAGLFAGRIPLAGPVPVVAAREAEQAWDADLAALVTLLRDTPADAPVPNWSVLPDTASFWTRRTAQELAVHRWDARTTGEDEPDPVPADIARDGIAEYFEAFAATAIAAGMAPRARATVALELTDTGDRLEHHLPDPGPATVLRGSASDLLLALWHRRDLLAHHVEGDRLVLERWPRI